MLISGTALNGAPSATDTGQEIVDFTTEHQDRLQISAVLMGVAMSSALVYLSGLYRALRRAEGGTSGLALTALGGGILAAAATVTGALIEGTITARISDLGTTGARAAWRMYLMSFGATLLGLLLLIGTTAIISHQHQLFATWFAMASAVLAIVSLIGAFSIGYTNTAIQATTGIALILDSVWILLTSLYLWRDPTLALP